MKTAFRIFQLDLKRIAHNRIALLVLWGLCILPSLYAWLNIAASWDPYTHTDSLQVAIVNEDQGYEEHFSKIHLEIGNQILAKLSQNRKLGWNFTDRSHALKGLKRGDYYAVIILPSNLSSGMLRLLENHSKAPEIEYYVNEKLNAIAPKITEKGLSVLHTQINTEFTQTLYQIIFQSLQSLSTLQKDFQGEDLAQQLIENLIHLQGSLQTQQQTLDAFRTLNQTLDLALSGSQKMLLQAQKQTQVLQKNLEDTQKKVLSGKQNAEFFLSQFDALYQKNKNFIQQFQNELSDQLNDLTQNLDTLKNWGKEKQKFFQELLENNQKILENLKAIQSKLPLPLKGLDKSIQIFSQIIQHQKDGIQLLQDLQKFTEEDRARVLKDQELIHNFLKELQDTLEGDGAQLLNSLHESLSTLASALEENLNQFKALGIQLQNQARQGQEQSEKLQNQLQSGDQSLDQLAQLFQDSLQKLNHFVELLQKAPQGEKWKQLEQLMQNDPQELAHFLVAPVHYETKTIFPIRNYGSAMAPFYTTLALWVGGIILVALLKVQVGNKTLLRIPQAKPWQCYLGRHLFLSLIGSIQALFVSLGDLLLLGIQAPHPYLFVFTCWLASFVFINIIYTLTLSLGDIGKAICVVLMVLQIAGAGGTFPIELAPPLFQKIYPLLPFVHSMNALRECIAGFYGHNWLHEIRTLLLFLIPSSILGFLLRKPLIRLNHSFEEALEKTKIM